MKNLIVIEGEKDYQYNNLQELVKDFIHPNYNEMSKEGQIKEIEKRAIANTVKDNVEMIMIDKEQIISTIDLKNKFIINDEYTYILSMLIFNKFVLLEEINANIFGKYMKQKPKKGNYIILNKFANEIMQKYIEDKRKEFNG